MSDPTQTDPPEDPQDRVTDVLRGIVAREADAAREGAASTPRVRYVGDYELLEEIARGGMGVVYKARQLTLNREVALKMILAGQLADEAAVERFQAEAEAAANLHHPNIVPIYEIGVHAGQHYFSMELVDGTSLADLVRAEPLPAKRAATYVRSAAEAIQYAHEEGTLHRDLKPSNVLIDRDDQPRITDFGLAKRIEGGAARTASGAAVGTPSYMPPEQAAGKRGLIGPASDVYSLGALLYELLTGRPPFRADNAVDTLMQVLENDPAPPRMVNPGVPVELETICLKCLEKRPRNRYRGAQELADDLGRFLDREPIRARSAGRLRKAWSWARSNPWSITTASILLAVAVLGLAYWLWVERDLWRYMAAHPDYVRESGTRTEGLRSLAYRTSIAVFLMAVLQGITRWDMSRGRRLPSRPYLLATVWALAAAGVASAVHLAMVATAAWVWEGTTLFLSWQIVVITIVLGANVIARTYHAYEGQASGAVLELSQEQEDELYELLKAGPRQDFRQRLRRARKQYLEWTGADPLHANQALRRMWGELRTVYPRQVPPKYTLLKLAVVLVLFIWVLVVLF